MFRWKSKNLSDADLSKFKRNLPAYLVLGLAVGAMTFFGVCTPTGRQMVGPSGIAGSVANQDITALEFRRAYITQSDQYQQQFKGNFDPVSMNLSAQVLNQLIDELIVYKEASRNGISATNSEVEKVIIDGEYFNDENGKFNPEAFSRYLRSQGFSEKSFTDYLRRSIVNSKLRNFITSTYEVSQKAMEIEYKLAETKLNVEFIKLDNQSINVEVTPQEASEFLAKEENQKKVRAYYDANQSEFNQEKQVKARHILISFQGARRATGEGASRIKEDARLLAKKVLDEVKKGQTSFENLAQKYTDEPGGDQKGGDLGFFNRETMVKEFSDVAFELNKGQVSGLVETPFGFHIIKVEDIRPAKSVNFDDAKTQIAEKLIKQEKAPLVLDEKAKSLAEAAKAGDHEAIKALGLQWQETGEFALNSRFIPGGIGSEAALKNAIYTLKNPGEVSGESISVNGATYVLRLKSRKDADLAKLTPESLKEMAQSQKFLQAFWQFNNLIAEIKDDYEEEGKISRNPDFLKYDELMKSGGAG